jgi:hypothetical protein
MENRLVSSADFKAFSEKLPEDLAVIAVKFVSLSRETLAKADFSAPKICEIAEEQPTFFIISQMPESFRETLHRYVDKFCDLRESQI